VRKLARYDKEVWLQKQCQDIETHTGNRRCREVYRVIKQINRKWKPTQSAIKDKNGKMLQGKEETKKRWSEYCSSLYNNTCNRDRLIAELEQITPPPTEDVTQDILLPRVETAIKGA